MKIKIYYNNIGIYFVKKIFATQNVGSVKLKDNTIAQKTLSIHNKTHTTLAPGAASFVKPDVFIVPITALLLTFVYAYTLMQ